jgi:hypothetical protein
VRVLRARRAPGRSSPSPPSSLVISSGMGADWSSTARVQRGESPTARCASTEDHQPPSPPLFREQEDDQATPLPSTWLYKPTDGPLTEPLHRRSIAPDVPVTVAADSSARYYSSSRAPELAQPPSLLRRILCRRTSPLGRGPFGTRVLMVTVSRQMLLPFLASILVPTACPALTSTPVPTSETRPVAIHHARRGIRHRLSRSGDRTQMEGGRI